MNTQLNTRRRTPTSQEIIRNERAHLEEQRASFIDQVVRHYVNGRRVNIRLITPRNSLDKELFINNKRIGAFIAEKGWLVFRVANGERSR